jgi:predicted DCC family thiol-disulfide oxidoreductase YuxK
MRESVFAVDNQCKCTRIFCTLEFDMIAPDRGGWQLEVFFDGDCQLCLREITLIRRWDREQRIRFTDIAAPDFHPELLGKQYEALMAEMHGRLPDGSWIQGVEVFRQMYALVGFRRLVALSRWPVISQVLDFGYALFARNRLRFTGRCSERGCNVKPSAAKSA